MTLGEFIKQYRKEHGDMSIRSFASMVGISPQQISNIEKGIGNNGKPMSSTMNTYKKIADAIGMTEQDFLNMLNDNVVVNPADYHAESIKNLPIIEIDGHLMLDFSALNESQRQAIIDVLEADIDAVSAALSDIKSTLSYQQVQDDQ